MTNRRFKAWLNFELLNISFRRISAWTFINMHASKQTHFATVPATSVLLTSGWSSLRRHNGICADSLELLHKCHFLSYPEDSGADWVLQRRKDDNAFHIHALKELMILK